MQAGAVASAAILGSQFTPAHGTRTGEWYRSLQKSPLNPPDAIFAPVWTTLYALIAIAGYRAWANRPARAAWFAQLALNAAWNPIFFGARKPRAAFSILLALLAAQGAFMALAGKRDRVAPWLFVPYVCWVLFAGYLNAEIVRRNAE